MPQKTMEETIALIEKGLDDISKNKATKAEVLELIDERVTEDRNAIKAAQEELEKANSAVTELQSQSDTLTKQLRQVKAASVAARGSDGSYRGLFASAEEAKAVGLTIMAAALHAGRSDASIAAKADSVLKALEKLGTEVKWTDDKGRVIEKDATTGGATTGSALVTTEQAPGIIKLLENYGVYRRNAQGAPMGAGQTLMPKIDSLLTVYVPGEGTAPTKTDPTIGLLTLTPKTMTALSAYSMELDEDAAIGLAELYGSLFARSFAYYEDLCGFLGDGTSTYFGFNGIKGALMAVDATIGNIKSLVVGAGNAYSELTLANFESLAGTLPVYADDADAKFYAHKYFFYTVMVKLALAAGGATATEIQKVGGKDRTYLGYPVEFTQVMPKAEANSQICCLLANLRQGAILGTRGGVEFAASDQRYFDQGLVAVRGRNRVAINAHGVGNTTNAGPICGLITAAS